MSSERRLHPYSILFAFLTQIRLFVIPGLLVALGATSRGNTWSDWQPWMMLLIVPNAIFAGVRYLTYRFQFAERELIIRSGLVFRRERHIPYARIQNIDAVQNVLHRLLGVAEVRLETGGAETAEATMSVLPLATLQEMREHVFAERVDRDATRPDPPVARAPALLALNTRELLLSGFIDNRGGVVIAAALGAMWEFGLFDRLGGWLFGDIAEGERPLRSLVRSLWSNATISAERVLIFIAGVVVLLLFVRLVSMLWAVVRLYGFQLHLVDDDLRREFGLLTKMTLTIPRRRVQVLTMREGPLHRYFRRVAVTVDTAGGREGQEDAQSDREYLAPILSKAALPAFVDTVFGVDMPAIEWHPPSAGAFRREVKSWLATAFVVAAAIVALAGWRGALVAPIVFAWAICGAHQFIKHLRWAEGSDSIWLASGWLWRRTVVVRFAKMQVVTRQATPFDRRFHMASVRVDTAASSVWSVIRIPYLDETVAAALHARLAQAAANTQFKW